MRPERSDRLGVFVVEFVHFYVDTTTFVRGDVNGQVAYGYPTFLAGQLVVAGFTTFVL
jgi:hypothetical protein